MKEVAQSQGAQERSLHCSGLCVWPSSTSFCWWDSCNTSWVILDPPPLPHVHHHLYTTPMHTHTQQQKMLPRINCSSEKSVSMALISCSLLSAVIHEHVTCTFIKFLVTGTVHVALNCCIRLWWTLCCVQTFLARSQLGCSKASPSNCWYPNWGNTSWLQTLRVQR